MYYTINDARMLPRCVQQPRLPLAVAAAGKRTLAVAAHHADAWITHGDATNQDSSPAGTEWAVGSLGSLRLRGRRREPDIWRWQGQNSYVGAAIAQKIDGVDSTVGRAQPECSQGEWRRRWSTLMLGCTGG